MKHLTKSILHEIAGVENLILPTDEQLNYPEKVLQFGTGVLLRDCPISTSVKPTGQENSVDGW